MPAKGIPRLQLLAAIRSLFASALALLGTGGIGPASAYIGDSFLLLSDAPGTWRGKEYKGWIRAEASEWQGRFQGPMSGPNVSRARASHRPVVCTCRAGEAAPGRRLTACCRP